jgi:hypothetical protein
MGVFLLLYYIFKKASKGLEKKERVKWIKWKLKPLLIVGFVVNVGLIMLLEVLLLLSEGY